MGTRIAGAAANVTLAIWVHSLLAKPLRVGDRAIKVVTGFVEFELACFGRLCRFCKKSCNLGGVHWLKTACGVKGLLKDGERIATGDDDAGRKIHRVVQTL